MDYRKLADEDEVEAAISVIRRSLGANKTRTSTKQKLGFQSGSATRDVFWIPNLGFWYILPKFWPKSRLYWLPFGVKEPKGKSTLHITVEINVGRGKRYSPAGLIICDEAGNRYLAHSGRINARKPWVNQKNFLQFCVSRGLKVITLNNRDFVLVGRVDNRIAKKIAYFIRTVRQFKDTPPSTFRLPAINSKLKRFKPKFVGKVKYKVTSDVVAEWLHDKVATVLEELLSPLECSYDQRKDLFLCDGFGNPIIVYEIKTSANTQSVYTGVGQLLLNGLSSKSKPKLVLVLPGKLDERTSSVIGSLGIKVLAYSWQGKKPKFRLPLQKDVLP